MINSTFSGNNSIYNQLYGFASKNLLQNDLMTLSLVLTIQPWFMRLLESIKTSMRQSELLNTSKVEPEKLLEAFGYCNWPEDWEAVKLVDISEVEELNTAQYKNTPNYCEADVHDSHSKLDTHFCKSDNCDHDEEDDEYLLSIHPNEIKYFTNPKTGRKIKKLVWKVPGWGKVFEKKWNFKDHIRMHMGEKPYCCNIWGKSFTQKGNLIKHNRQHVFSDLKSRKVHEWNVCHKKFTEKYNLKVSIVFWNFKFNFFLSR